MQTMGRNGVGSVLRRALLPGLAVAWALMGTPALADDIELKQVQVLPGTGGDQSAEVRLRLVDAKGQPLAERPRASVFLESNPDRLQIDIDGAKVAPGLDLASITGGAKGLVKSVSAKTMDDGQGIITRVTVALTGPVRERLETADDGTIHVYLQPGSAGSDALAQALKGAQSPASSTTGAQAPGGGEGLGKLSGPKALPAGPTVASLDFKNLDEVSRVIVGLKNSSAYVASQPRSDMLVVDFPGAFLPSSLTRALDTSQFLSPVSMVRAYRTSQGARVALTLRRPTTDYKVHMGPDGLVYIDVKVPDDMRQQVAVATQQPSTVSPGTTGEGIRNAYQHEALIGASGRTVNPQAAFGTGGGALDASSLLGMSAGFMIDNRSATSLPFSGQHISLNLVNADIHSIFRLISSVSRLNIVASDDVKGTVTVQMQDVPWDEALAAILQAKGLGSQRFGNIVRVAPIETIKAEQQAALEAKRAKEELAELQLLVLPLDYAQAKELKEQVDPLKSSRGSVQVDTHGNQLIIKDTESNLAQIRELVRHLDKPTPQVLIEARVVEANSNKTRALGIEWGGDLNANTTTGYATGLFFPNSVGLSGALTTEGGTTFYDPGTKSLLVDLGPTGATSGVALSLGSIPGLVNLDARLSAMESDGGGKVVSSPRVTTLDNETATIIQGQRIPFLSTSSGGTQVQFIDAALELDVTPHITTDNKVVLKIDVTNNRADFSQLVQGQPAIQIKEAHTYVLVADGDTTVIGGVAAVEDTYTQDRVPFFYKIPLIGWAFKNSNRETTRNELLVFITPHIISRAVTDANSSRE